MTPDPKKDEEQPLTEFLYESVHAVVEMMNNGDVDSEQVYPKARPGRVYHGD